ncbi:MAG: Xylulose kinase [Lentisphaerae bacterium ADurb.Bin242]|nr:MAG: Xylulose kinase [Lentisphaerae bacterium ADurb.Bin242]
MSYLGIDIGTSSCKAVVFNADGRPAAPRAVRNYKITSPLPGFAELDPSIVMTCCFEVISEAAKSASEKIAAICVSSQGEAFTPIGTDGKALDNAMVSSDSRSLECMNDFTTVFGSEKLYRITGHTPSTLFSLFKLLWLKQNKPHVFANARKILCFEDLLAFSLGVEPAMGWPLAGRTMLFDIAKHEWSHEILDALDLPSDKLAKVLPSGSVAGQIPDEYASSLGLPKGVKFVTGGHDQTIGALGAGVFEAGDAMYAAGSVECICPVIPELTLTQTLFRNNLCSYDYPLPGLWTTVAYSLTGSNLVDYFRNTLGNGEDYSILTGEMPDFPTSLLTLPYFTPSGTPYFDQKTPACIYGMRMTTSRGELLKGMLEGIALEMKLNLTILEESGIHIERFMATGGGCRNPHLVQLKADVLNRPLMCPSVEESGCRGAALLAQSADENMSVKELSHLRMESGEYITPRTEYAQFYEEKFEKYKHFSLSVRNLFKKN